ncbi:MAG: TRAM domain-containing protein, partial [Myxococcota bacterium]
HDLSKQGEGVGRTASGITVFVPYTAPGDRVRVEVLSVAKRFWRGQVKEWLVRSTQRQEPQCAWFGRCGGCDWQHLTYAAQSEAKRRIVQQSLRRLGQIQEMPEVQFHTTSEPWHTRDRVRWHVNKRAELGFFARKSQELLPIERCPVLSTALVSLLQVLQRRLPHLLLPVCTCSAVVVEGKILMALDLSASTVPNAQSKHDWGATFADWFQMLQEEMPNVVGGGLWCAQEHVYTYGCAFLSAEGGVRVRAEGFAQAGFQQNRLLREVLCTLWEQLPQPPSNLVEIYAGAGNLSSLFLDRVSRFLGLEFEGQAWMDAQALLVQESSEASMQEPSEASMHASSEASAVDMEEDSTHGGRRLGAKQFCAFDDRKDALCALLEQHGWSEVDVILLDPPRRGLHSKLRTTLAKVKPRAIMYVSCDSATLARDLSEFLPVGYRIKALHGLDMMPQTAHVEVVVLLLRVDSGVV